MSAVAKVPLTEVRRLAVSALERHGLHRRSALAVADTITEAEQHECLSHGLFRVPGCDMTGVFSSVR